MRVCLKNTFIQIEQDAGQQRKQPLEAPQQLAGSVLTPGCKVKSKPRSQSAHAALACEWGGQQGEQAAELEVAQETRSHRRCSSTVEHLERLTQILESDATESGTETARRLPGRPRAHTIQNIRPLSKTGHVMSSGSVSTMASSPLEELPTVGSSNSVSTMNSDFVDCEDGVFVRGHRRMPSEEVPETEQLFAMETLREEASSGASASDKSERVDLTEDFSPRCEAASSSAAKARAAPRDSRHSRVPKTVNLAAEYAKQSTGQVTTVMIRNIPNRYSQRELMDELKGLGFEGTFDFLYIPLDLGTMSNVGYAFVNFVNPVWAERCKQSFQGHHFKKHRQAGKVAAVSTAHIQGLEANLRHYEKSAVKTARLRQRRPIVLAALAHSLT